MAEKEILKIKKLREEVKTKNMFLKARCFFIDVIFLERQTLLLQVSLKESFLVGAILLKRPGLKHVVSKVWLFLIIQYLQNIADSQVQYLTVILILEILYLK